MKKLFLAPLISIITLLACNPTPPPPTIISVDVTATNLTTTSGTSQPVKAEVTGTGAFNSNVTWTSSIAGVLATTTGNTNTFTAPVVTTSTEVTLTATSIADSSKTGSLKLTINPIPVVSTVESVTVTTNTNTLTAASSATLSATVTGTNNPSNEVTWSIASGAGALSAITGSSITFTAPSLNTASTTIIRATSVQDPSKNGTVTVNVGAVVPSVTSVTVVAATSNIDATDTTLVSATVNGVGAFLTGVTWSIDSGQGSLDAVTGSSITFTAPILNSASTTIIRATSVQDPSKSGTVTINVAGSIITGVSINSQVVNLREDGSSLLQGVVSGSGKFNPAVTWSIESGGIGSLSNATSNSVLFTAPSTSFGRVVRITAMSVQDPLQKKTIYLGVHPKKQSISGSGNHSLAIKSDGTILAWGLDDYGQLGNGATTGLQVTPVAVLNATSIVAVAAGQAFSLALKSDGTMLAWGWDNYGKLGNGAIIGNQTTPVDVINATGVVAIAAGENHSLALKSDGTILAWGLDDFGQLGNGATTGVQAAPVAVLNATGIVAIATGSEHSLALKSDGTILAWGRDSAGQLGNGGTNVDQPTPVAVTNATGIVAIAAGGTHSLALKSDGTILAWGNDSSGQLGDGGTNVFQTTPVDVINATGVVAFAAGHSFSLALKSDGTMLAWGNDGHGQLGNGGTNVDQPTPVAVLNATGIVDIAAGGSTSLALKSDGTMLAWGFSVYGQLGDGGSNFEQASPVTVLLGTFTIRLP